jgi:Cd2+/Zn2+-exporting ATPase
LFLEFCFFVSLFDIGIISKIVLSGFSYAIISYDVIWFAIKNIFKGKVFDEHFLMVVATVGALCLKQNSEAIAVMLFYQIGELLQDIAVENSKKSIKN